MSIFVRYCLDMATAVTITAVSLSWGPLHGAAITAVWLGVAFLTRNWVPEKINMEVVCCCGQCCENDKSDFPVDLN